MRFIGTRPVAPRGLSRAAAAIAVTVLSATLLGTTACGRSATPRGENGPLQVFVSILPQAFFVERIGGDRVRVEVLVGPGQSPHVFEPTPRQATALAQANVYFTIGLPFEQRMVSKLEGTFANLSFVDTAKGVPRRLLESGEACDHDHGPGTDQQHHHDEAAHDPHIWMDPQLAKQIARNICEGLCAHDPVGTELFRANLARLERELDDLHAELSAALQPLRGREFFVYHAAFGYFAAAYGLKQVPVEVGAREPTPAQLLALIERARAAEARVIFVLPQFSKRSAAALAREVGAVIVPIDDLSRDYLVNLRDVARKIRAAFPQGSPS